MTGALAEALADLAEEVDGAVASTLDPALAHGSWSRGRALRRRARLGRLAVAAAVAAAATVALLPGSWHGTALPAGRTENGPVGHPQRIAKPWHVGELPQRGEPLAGIAYAGEDYLAGRWYAVTQGGGLRQLPVAASFRDAVVPTLSADGRLLGYLDRNRGHYVLRDVVTGDVTPFPDVRDQSAYQDVADPSNAPFTVLPQTPGHAAPDGRHVVVTGTRPGGPGGTPALLVLGADGSVRPLAQGRPVNPVGWIDDTTVLTTTQVQATGPDGATLSSTVTPVAIGLDGSTRTLPSLRPDRPFSGSAYSQWSPSLSPDHTTLAVGLGREEGPDGPGVRVLTFDLATGAQLDSTFGLGDIADAASVPADAGSKHSEWRGGDWYGVRPAAVLTEVARELRPDQTALVVDPRLGLGWLDLADSALSGPVHASPWGTNTSWVAWRWRELLLGAALAGFLLLVRRGLSRRLDVQAPGRTRAAVPTRAWRSLQRHRR